MFYYKFTSGTPYCGTENEYYHKFEEQPSDNELEEMSDEYEQQAYDDYSYLHSGWNEENLEDMTEEEAEEYMDNFRADCYCEYVEISEDEYNENA
jgi:hypothetical protein